ncbi:hypothetical protein A5892_12710 [Halotalea alkalilenta]|uniref:Translocation and assembly module subunit TamA n=2 Tax=Halotalea alkalilenta TaxID=376489 RepID=A0A172YK78_9GAMM|nr:hypothetical protein A5892_12710 [Halotalea alkalilenta]
MCEMTRSSWALRLSPWLLGALVAPQAAQALDAEVRGLGGPAADNVEAYLDALDIPANARLDIYDSEVMSRVSDALRAFGYYEPQISVDFRDRDSVVVDIVPGERVIVRNVYVRVEGEGGQDDSFQRLLDASELLKDEGRPLLHAHYETLKTQLDTLALQRGYFNSQYRVHRLEVRPWDHSANVYLVMDSGRRYHFGEVSYSGSQIRQERLEAMRPFQPGDPYLTDDLALYNSRLGQAGWFRSVSVRPRLEREAQPSAPAGAQAPSPDDTSQGGGGEQEASAAAPEVPVDVSLIAADRHRFETGIGFATDVGPRLQLTWRQPWRNDLGHSWENRLYLSSPRQTLGGMYKIPLDDPLRDSYEFGYGFENLDDNDTRSRRLFFTPARVWQFDNGWSQRVYVRVSQENFTQADQSDNVFLITPGVSWGRTAVDDQRFPMHGNRQDLLIEGSSDQLGSDITFLRSVFTTQWIESIGNDNRFFVRGNVGAIETDDFPRMPPSLRFFAGGDTSVRGYSYETLAPRNDDGELLGGQQMFTGTLEYQRRVTGDWWSAAFYDFGDAFDSWSDSSLKTAAGLGVRWISPVGPIRFDIAHPFDDEDNSWRIHFAIGPEF